MSRPLRFLQVTSFYPPYSFGGDGIYVQELSHALADRGHQVDVVHCEDAYRVLSSQPPTAPDEAHPNVRRHGLRSGVGRLSPLITQQSGRPGLKGPRLRKILAATKPDVIHYHNISLLGPGVLALSPNDGSRPLKLYTTHEHWLICPTHVLWKFDERPCERPECLRCVLKARRPPQLWRATGLLARAAAHVDRFLSPSKFSIEMHRQRGFDGPFVHFPSFARTADGEHGAASSAAIDGPTVDTPGYEPLGSSAPDGDTADGDTPGHDTPGREAPRHDPPYFLFVGRLEKNKGVDTLISAWRCIVGADLFIVGTGGEERRLRELAAADSRVRFLGHRTAAELGGLYAGCRALIVPSTGYEVFGLVVPEAFARKAPVIVRDLGGLPEMVTETGGGLLFGNQDELVAAVAQITETSGLRDELGARGYAAYTERWTREVHVDRYLRLLRELAEEKYGRVPWDEGDAESPPVPPAGEATTDV